MEVEIFFLNCIKKKKKHTRTHALSLSLTSPITAAFNSNEVYILNNASLCLASQWMFNVDNRISPHFSRGWHPYFNLGAMVLKKCSIQPAELHPCATAIMQKKTGWITHVPS
jgi:hypothetical protein